MIIEYIAFAGWLVFLAIMIFGSWVSYEDFFNHGMKSFDGRLIALVILIFMLWSLPYLIAENAAKGKYGQMLLECQEHQK